MEKSEFLKKMELYRERKDVEILKEMISLLKKEIEEKGDQFGFKKEALKHWEEELRKHAQPWNSEIEKLYNVFYKNHDKKTLSDIIDLRKDKIINIPLDLKKESTILKKEIDLLNKIGD